MALAAAVEKIPFLVEETKPVIIITDDLIASESRYGGALGYRTFGNYHTHGGYGMYKYGGYGRKNYRRHRHRNTKRFFKFG